MKLYDAKTSFASGELSPALWGRVDLAQYQTGARTLQNFIVLPQGGLINRPGTQLPLNEGGKIFVQSAMRLVPFVFSEEDSCVLAFLGNGGVFLYENDKPSQQVVWGNLPYTPEQLSRLRWLQSGDVLYLFHPDVPVHTLSRTAGGWKVAQVTFENGPFEDLNTDPDRTVEFTRIGSSGDMNMKASFDMAGMLYEGQLIRVEAEVKAYSETLSVARANETAFGDWVEVSRPVFGPFTFRTSGKWTGTLEVERKRPDMDWEPFKTYASEANAEENFSYSGDVEEYSHSYRFRYKGNKTSLTVNFSFEGGLVNRVFKVKSFYKVSGTVNEAVVTDVDGNTEDVGSTDAWAVGSFGPEYGYPSMGIFHQERLVLANTRHSPQTIWMSQPASWHNFGTSIPSKDDDSITVTLASKEVNEIRGLASRGDLLIFTAGGEWSAKAGSKSDVFTPSSLVVTPSGYRGSADIAPLDVGDVTLFVQRQGTVVRSIGYSLDVDGYASSDISILAEHLFKDNPVVAWAYQQTPWSVVWCVLADGTVAALTLQREHQVNAWTHQVFGGGPVMDVCCIPGTVQDEVYFVVKWDGAGDYPYRVERLRHRDVNGERTFRDGGDGGPAVHWILECLDWERAINDGTLQGRHKQMPAVTVRLLETKTFFGGVITENSARLDEVQFPLEDSPGWYPDGLFSGDVRFLPPGGTGRTCRLRLENGNAEPYTNATPITILGIYPELVIGPGPENEG